MRVSVTWALGITGALVLGGCFYDFDLPASSLGELSSRSRDSGRTNDGADESDGDSDAIDDDASDSVDASVTDTSVDQFVPVDALTDTGTGPIDTGKPDTGVVDTGTTPDASLTTCPGGTCATGYLCAYLTDSNGTRNACVPTTCSPSSTSSCSCITSYTSAHACACNGGTPVQLVCGD